MSDQSQTYKSVLVVDDEEAARQMLEEFLETIGYRAFLAEDGVSAVNLIESHQPDVVLTDVNMPNMDGTKLLAEISRRWPKIPVILLTGQPNVETAIASLRLGAVDYLTKPYDLNHLRDTIEKALKQADKLSTSQSVKDSTGMTFDATYMMDNVSVMDSNMVAGYEVIRTISEGNMGIVYLVKKDGEKFALKIIRPESGAGDEGPDKELRERFIREAEVASEITHPNICRVYDYGLAESGVPYIVMEYLDGSPMPSFMKRLPENAFDEKTSILRQLADAIGCIHDKDICHRDVKPENVIIVDRKIPKLTDFGVARTPGSELTLADQIIGSPLYMAPEAYESASVDRRADLFSFGVMCYEFYLGRRPFQGSSINQIANHICHGRPPQPRRLLRNFPRRLQDILAKCLKKEPDERYQNAYEIVRDFDAFLESGDTWQSKLKSMATSSLQLGEDWD